MVKVWNEMMRQIGLLTCSSACLLTFMWWTGMVKVTAIANTIVIMFNVTASVH